MIARSRQPISASTWCNLCQRQQWRSYHPTARRSDEDEAKPKLPSRYVPNPSPTPSTSYIYTRPSDALTSTANDDLLSSLSSPASTSSTMIPNRSPKNVSDPTSEIIRSTLARAPRRRQKQALTAAEAATFADLLQKLLPSSSAGSTSTDKKGQDKTSNLTPLMHLLNRTSNSGLDRSPSTSPSSGIDSIRAALESKTEKKIKAWERKARANTTPDGSRPLSIEETDQFDKLTQEVEETIFDEIGLYEWARTNVWAHEARYGTDSNLYPHLILYTFKEFKNRYRSPYAALDLFETISTISPLSFVKGCGQHLFNEVMKLQWEVSQGDIELVCTTLERMRSSGIMMNQQTAELVESIGQAIRIDGERAEARIKTGAKTDMTLTEIERINLVDEMMDEATYLVESRARFFNTKQIEAWKKMEGIVEDNLKEADQRRIALEEERWAAKERMRAMREEDEQREAEEASPSLVKGAATMGWSDDFWQNKIVGQGSGGVKRAPLRTGDEDKYNEPEQGW